MGLTQILPMVACVLILAIADATATARGGAAAAGPALACLALTTAIHTGTRGRGHGGSARSWALLHTTERHRECCACMRGTYVLPVSQKHTLARRARRA